MIATATVGFVGGVLIGRLWWESHPQIIDRGDGPGNKRAFWNAHSKLHLAGAAIVAVLPAVFDGFFSGFLVSSVLWTLVEVAQRFPRDGLGGMFEVADVVWDVVGAAMGAGLGALVGSLI